MHIRFFIVALLLCVAGFALAQAYKWVDDDGIVHYSDRPHPGAEEVVLPESTRSPRVAVPQPSPRAGAPAGEQEAATAEDGYTALDIAAPSSEETLWNIQGTLEVTLNVQPDLKEGHRIRVYFDGEPRMVSSTSFTIPEVYRGAHNIQAEIVDQTGRMQIRSTATRFYVQQTSVAGSNRPNAFPR